MNKPITSLVVVASLLDRQGRCLLAKRSAGKSFAGLWELPGGKVEAGERLGEALSRELQEELGIVADVGTRLWDCSSAVVLKGTGETVTHLTVLMWILREWAGDPQPLVHDQIAWLSLGEIKTYPSPLASARLFAYLAQKATN